MEKEALIANLRSRVGEDDFATLSETTVSNVADTVLSLFADDGKVTEDTYKMPVALLKNYAGQYRHDLKTWTEGEKAKLSKEYEKAQARAVAKAVSEAKAEWEKTPGVGGKGSGAPLPTPGEPDGQGTPADVQKLVQDMLDRQNASLLSKDGEIGKQLASIQAFMERMEAERKAAQASQIRSELKKHLTERKATREAVIDLAIEKLKIDEGSSLAELKVKVEKDYESIYKKFYGDGGKPFGGDSSGSGGETDQRVKDYITKRAKQDEEVEAHKKSLKERLI